LSLAVRVGAADTLGRRLAGDPNKSSFLLSAAVAGVMSAATIISINEFLQSGIAAPDRFV
jgi:hypothetical protein